MRGLVGLDLTVGEPLPLERSTPIEADASLAARVPGLKRNLFDQAIRAEGSGDVLASKPEQLGRLDAQAVGVGMDLAEATVRIVA